MLKDNSFVQGGHKQYPELSNFTGVNQLQDKIKFIDPVSN